LVIWRSERSYARPESRQILEVLSHRELAAQRAHRLRYCRTFGCTALANGLGCVWRSLVCLTRIVLVPLQLDGANKTRAQAGAAALPPSATGSRQMVGIVPGEQDSVGAAFANRALSGSPQRVAVSDLPVIDLGPFMRESAVEDRLHTACMIRSACIDIGFFYVTDAVVHRIETCRGDDNPSRYEDVTTAEYVRVLREDAQRTGRPSVATTTAQRLNSN
jgi:hypothetical protein